MDRFERWLERDPDERTRAELRTLIDGDDAETLTQRFAGRLAFGTAGLRGIVGAGPMCMNRLVVRETSAGLGQYLIDSCPNARTEGVVIGYDGRLDSEAFSVDAAGTLAAMGIKVYLFDRIAATPLCAFAVCDVGAAAGIMITASHNPPEYNGYKVYWRNGAQIVEPHDQGIALAIDTAAIADLPWTSPEGHVESLGQEMVDRYFDAVEGLSTQVAPATRGEFAIAYTPMHGVGAAYVEAITARVGFTGLQTEPSQREPDGHFPTVRFPNPEEPGAMDAVIALAKEIGADIALANDPDADRLAVAARTKDGEFRLLTGDQIGALLGATCIEASSDDGPRSVATTIVSSTLLSRIAQAAGVNFFETLTGFKWIATGALARPDERFLFGYEEAIGYTIGEIVRDKDGVSALVTFAELAESLHNKGSDVWAELEVLYRRHGLHLTTQRSLTLAPGTPGSSITDALRANAPSEIAGRAVLVMSDLSKGRRYPRGQDSEVVDLPLSDVLIYELEGDARVIVRPSGTEPKVKCYYELRAPIADGETLADVDARTQVVLKALIDAHQATLAKP